MSRARTVRRTTTSAKASGTRQRFRIRFMAERTIDAKSLSEALAQVKSLGATDITSVKMEAKK
jgi:hypothetical protein